MGVMQQAVEKRCASRLSSPGYARGRPKLTPLAHWPMNLSGGSASARREPCRPAKDSAVQELRSFATGLQQELAAVSAALDLPWSNGQTEGQVNWLKCIKRMMYGRASFE
jgi:hypothetical protein